MSHQLIREYPASVINHVDETQSYGVVTGLVPGLSMPVREEIVKTLNQALADSIMIRDLYKKHHWQIRGRTFYQLHLLFGKHFDEQVFVVDQLAERIEILGGVSIAMPHDVAEITTIVRVPAGREIAIAQLSRLVSAHEVVIAETRVFVRRAQELGDEVSSDLLVRVVLRTNEMQAWFLAQQSLDEIAD